MPVQERIFETPSGKIHYWVSRAENSEKWLIFLPGLTADHHLFDRQMEYFAGSAKRYNRRWAREEGHPLVWIPSAGHNANTDAPEEVNRLIQDCLSGDWIH